MQTFKRKEKKVRIRKSESEALSLPIPRPILKRSSVLMHPLRDIRRSRAKEETRKERANKRISNDGPFLAPSKGSIFILKAADSFSLSDVRFPEELEDEDDFFTFFPFFTGDNQISYFFFFSFLYL